MHKEVGLANKKRAFLMALPLPKTASFIDFWLSFWAWNEDWRTNMELNWPLPRGGGD